MTDRPIPNPVYRCRGSWCLGSAHAPKVLYWWDGETRSCDPPSSLARGRKVEGWYCVHCMDFYCAVFGPPSMEEHMKEQSP